jgi:sensor domain CHASE-containing protein
MTAARSNMKIQKPSKGHVVIFTAWRGQGPDSGKVDEYAGIIVNVHEPQQLTDAGGFDHPGDKVDLVTFGPSSFYHNNGVRHDADGATGTWRYPPREAGEIEV